MGTLRFGLAFLVMLSHYSGTHYVTNYGQVAVLGFYFISGSLMAMIFKRFQQKSPHPVRDFFLDRVIKIWPSYVLVLIATATFFYLTGIMQPDPVDLLRQIALVTNGYAKMFPWGYPMVPPSWSLGVEVQFYLIVPLLALMSYRVKVALLYILAFGHLIALSSSRAIGDFIVCRPPFTDGFCTIPISDYLGFDLPFLIVVIFLAGNLSYDRFILRKYDDANLYVLWAIYAICLFLVFPYKAWIRNLSANETLLAVTLFLPICLVVLIQTHNVPPVKLDRFLGTLSYPLFLSHFLAMHIVHYLFGGHTINNRAILQYYALSLVLALVVAAFQVYVADRLRYFKRGFGSSLPSTNPQPSTKAPAHQPAE